MDVLDGFVYLYLQKLGLNSLVNIVFIFLIYF